MESKTCIKCKEPKPVEAFQPGRNTCKRCASEYMRKYRGSEDPENPSPGGRPPRTIDISTESFATKKADGSENIFTSYESLAANIRKRIESESRSLDALEAGNRAILEAAVRSGIIADIISAEKRLSAIVDKNHAFTMDLIKASESLEKMKPPGENPAFNPINIHLHKLDESVIVDTPSPPAEYLENAPPDNPAA